jgi:hypothetical protein
MIFESWEYTFIVPLDSSEGRRYVELVIDNILTEDLNQLYGTTTHKEDYINPDTDALLTWRSINSFSLDSNA